MAYINVRRDVEDKFYRYKMPKLVAKIEGKGNGIKTVITNMSDISKCLARPPSYATKFFGFELGSLTTTDSKNDKYVVNGAHDAEKLASLLDVFIKKFVLCGDCSNPETEFNIKKNDDIFKNCKACGAVTVVAPHKLNTYIIKNPPPTSSKKEKKNKKEGKKSSRAEQIENEDDNIPTPPESNEEDADANEEDEEGDDEFTQRIQQEAERLKVSKIDDDDWAEDMSPAAVAARQRELAPGGAVDKLMEADADGEDGEEEEESPLDIFGDYVAENKDVVSKQNIKQEAERLKVRADKALVILMQVLFDDKTTDKTISKYAPLLKMFYGSDDVEEVDEKLQKAVLGGFERLVGEVHPNLMSQVPKFLLTMYNLDLFDEQVILAWGEKASKKYVDKKVSKEIRSKAEPFLEWLKNAEDDEGDD